MASACALMSLRQGVVVEDSAECIVTSRISALSTMEAGATTRHYPRDGLADVSSSSTRQK
jgi:hypothetical protein